MTPFENSLYIAMIAPVLALVVSAVLKPARSFRWNALLIALSGISGTVAAAYGAIAEEPFTMAVPMFYGMTIALDRFSAIFFLSISIAIAAAGLYALAYGTAHSHEGPRLRQLGILTAIFVIAAQWVLISGNIIGFIAAWAVMTLSTFFITLLPMGESHKTTALQFLTVSQFGIAALTAGFFVLSSGALFSDFGTLAYLAGQAEPMQLTISYGLLLFGFGATIGLVPIHRWFRSVSASVPAHIATLLRGTLSGVAFYGFIRCILFILPSLSVWFALPIAILGAITMICGAVCALNETHIQRIFANMSLYGFGLATIMISGAMTFQALAQYDAMNVMLFAAFIHILITSIAGSGLMLVGDAMGQTLERGGGLAARKPKLAIGAAILLLCAVGFPPFASFTSMWMMGGTFKTMFTDLSFGTLFHGLPAGYAIISLSILVLCVLALVFSVVAVGRVMIGMFLGASRSESDAVIGEATDSQLVPIVLLAFLALVSGFAVPQLLVSIGADPLTDAAGTFNGGIVTPVGTLRMGGVGVTVFALVCIAWYFRASWLDRIPTFASIESRRTTLMKRIAMGNSLKNVWNRALEKLRR